MCAHVSWHLVGTARVACYVYPARPPILDVSEHRAGFALSITSAKEAVSPEHVEFARALAAAAQQYAEECARWVDQDGSEPAREPSSAA